MIRNRCTLILSFLLLVAASQMAGGCLSAAGTSNTNNDTTKVIDVFPKPVGESLIPLLRETGFPGGQTLNYAFNYVEFDSSGGLIRRQSLTLQVTPKSADAYSYAFEDPTTGFLIRYRDGNGNPDSAGIWIVGKFRDTTLTYYADPVLWLPQTPRAPGTTWPIDAAGRRMELVNADTACYTEVLFDSQEEIAKAPVQYGFQRQPTLLFKETAGDNVTYYHFRRGVGLVGFERSYKGKLIATGVIKQFYGKDTR